MVAQSKKEITEKKDVRENKGSGTYPNYYSYVSKSGHKVIMDDSENNEHVTIEHRSGAKIQFHPDGAIVVRAHNGKQEIVFGDSEIVVTGAQDITVQGGGSLRVQGDYNMHVEGNMMTTVNGQWEMMANKGFNLAVNGPTNIASKGDMAIKSIEGNMELTTDGALGLTADGGVNMSSTNEGAGVNINSMGPLSMTGKASAQFGSMGNVEIKGARIDHNKAV